MRKPFALLDADFILKLYEVSSNSGQLFIDLLLKLDFEFCCHEQILIEVERHNITASEWIRDKVKAKRIILYSDSDILQFLKEYIRSEASSCRYYLNYLKSACDIYGQSYFYDCYGHLEDKVEQFNVFVQEINKGDAKVGCGNNLGELKNAVLLQLLHLCTKISAYILCSDDKNARYGLFAYATRNKYSLNCISPFGFFYIARKENLAERQEFDEYFRSWLESTNSSVIRLDGRKGKTVSAKTVYDDIWADKISYNAQGYYYYQ